jgi:hypothetical protein
MSMLAAYWEEIIKDAGRRVVVQARSGRSRLGTRVVSEMQKSRKESRGNVYVGFSRKIKSKVLVRSCGITSRF